MDKAMPGISGEVINLPSIHAGSEEERTKIMSDTSSDFLGFPDMPPADSENVNEDNKDLSTASSDFLGFTEMPSVNLKNVRDVSGHIHAISVNSRTDPEFSGKYTFVHNVSEINLF